MLLFFWSCNSLIFIAIQFAALKINCNLPVHYYCGLAFQLFCISAYCEQCYYEYSHLCPVHICMEFWGYRLRNTSFHFVLLICFGCDISLQLFSSPFMSWLLFAIPFFLFSINSVSFLLLGGLKKKIHVPYI